MRLPSVLRPRPALSEAEVARGLRMMTWEGVTSIAMYSVTTSGLLTAFALALGANSFQIGILAAIAFIMQPIQVPSILLVERLRLRKAIAVLTWFPAQGLWIPIALIPLLVDVPSGAAVALLLGFTGIRGALTAVCNAAWFSWVRDLVPQAILGRFYSRRLALATVAAIAFGLAGAGFVDYWRERMTGQAEILGYTAVLLFGAIFLGLSDPLFMAQMPEQRMAPATGQRSSLRSMVARPFRDRNFRQLMHFLFWWGFASNLAVPFFSVFMLKQLEFPVSAVIGLTVLSQVFNVLFLRVWGPFADRFGSKVVLSLCASLYLMVVLGWVFTTMPDEYVLTVPLVVGLHVFAGIAAAGVNLTVNTLGYKLAPQEHATSYLVGSSLATNLGAGLGPLLGGRLADFFSARELALTLSWRGPDGSVDLPTILLSGFDFLFLLAFLIGVVILNTLTTIREEGEADRKAVLDELFIHMQGLGRAVGAIPGLRLIGGIPYAYLRHVPGADVALGVTAYQLAHATRAAVLMVARSEQAVEEVARRVREAVAEAATRAEDLREQGVHVAASAARGAVHALGEAEVGLGHLVEGAVVGTVDGLSRAGVDLWDAIWGAAYGTVQGAREAGVDTDHVARHAVKGARQAAEQLGVPPEEAAARAMQGALEAADDLARRPFASDDAPAAQSDSKDGH